MGILLPMVIGVAKCPVVMVVGCMHPMPGSAEAIFGKGSSLHVSGHPNLRSSAEEALVAELTKQSLRWVLKVRGGVQGETSCFSLHNPHDGSCFPAEEYCLFWSIWALMCIVNIQKWDVNSSLVPSVEVWQIVHCLVNCCVLLLGLHWLHVVGAVNVHLTESCRFIVGLYPSLLLHNKHWRHVPESWAAVSSHRNQPLFHSLDASHWVCFSVKLLKQIKVGCIREGGICSGRQIAMPPILLLQYKSF